MSLFVRLLLISVLPGTLIAQTNSKSQPDVSSHTYHGPVVTAPYSRPGQSMMTGTVQLAIKLQDPPLVVAVGANAKQRGIAMTVAQQQAYLDQLQQKQDAVMTTVRALGGVELGRVSKAHNAVMVSIDASQIAAIHGISGVAAVRPVADIQTTFAGTSSSQPDLATTLSYVGGLAVQGEGFLGQGIRIAMLDTGIDYTHANLGGSGNVADFQAAMLAKGSTPPPSLFPTSKVLGGFDFTGDLWPNGPLAPDPNPLDLNGHGTLTADTAAGHSLDGLHVGAAPGAQLYAVKVCSSVSTSCSGVAVLQGFDFALDPNNTRTLNSPVDIISMSVGGRFGQREDDQSEAFTDIVNFGVVCVLSAGNDGDVPYVLSQPASAPEVLAVAATTSVVGFGIPLVVNSPASIAGTYRNTATLDFAPVNSAVTADVAYLGQGCPGDTYLANPSGKIALVDRGGCAVSLKIDGAARAGAVGVLIGLVAPGDAVTFAVGGGSDFVPSLVITQSVSQAIQSAGTTVNATISPSNAISTASNVASYSSRGPNYSYNMLKPDISAPGTIFGAAVGSGNGQVTESGTSFACPMTAGAAALLLSKNRSLLPADVKALLMENSEPLVFNNALTQPDVLGPMSRIGAGELRVIRSATSTTSVWDSTSPLAISLSFGTYRVSSNQTYKKKVIVNNYAASTRTYSIVNNYRDAPNTTGFTLSFPGTIVVPAHGSASFILTGTLNAALLPDWTPDGGIDGGNGELLNMVEYAGYLTLSDPNDTVHIPWHILPHKSANVQVGTNTVALNGNIQNMPVSNLAAPIGGQVDSFSLTGIGTQFPSFVLPAPGAEYAVINLQATGLRLVCTAGCTTSTPTYGIQFAVTTFGQRAHPDVPAEFDVQIDANNDGIADFVVFNGDIGLVTAGTLSGQNGIFVADVAGGILSGPYFYTIADLDSANAILTVPLSALSSSTSGVTVAINSPFTFSVLAFDNYYTGNLTDLIPNMRYELDMPQNYTFSTFTVPGGFNGNVPVVPNNAANVYFSGPYNGNSPSQIGQLLLYTNGKTGQEASVVVVQP